jgi:4-amino-4-deoxy-L-arabinose transferase-like glycosyltransferase
MYRIKKLFLFESPNYFDWGIYFTAFILLQIPAIVNFYYNDGNHNFYLQFAESLLHGNLNLPASTEDIRDLALYQGKIYLPYPPLPTIILLPFVAIFGANHVNTVAIATLMACICLYLMYKVLVRLKVEIQYIPWLMSGLFFGTGFWYALFVSHHLNAFAHITSFLFQLLIINEILGKRRWWLIGIFIGCTFLTRQFTFFYILFAAGFMFYEYKVREDKLYLTDVLSLSLPVVFFVILYLLYNYVRFGNCLDTGYNHIIYIGVLSDRVQQYGVFSSKYFLFNLYSTLIKGFNIEIEGKTHLTIKDMDAWGTSLLSASPFIIASIKSQWPRILKFAAWSTIFLIYLGQLFYHNNGYQQVNTSRFCLDFLPLLMVLVALGMSKIPLWLTKTMVSYAILLNIVSFIIHLCYQ